MEEPINVIAPVTAKHGERADEILADTSFDSGVDANSGAFEKLESMARSLGDSAIEEALGLVQRWMSLVDAFC